MARHARVWVLVGCLMGCVAMPTLAKDGLIPEKIKLRNAPGAKAEQELFVIFYNNSGRRLQAETLKVDLDGVTYQGGLFAKTASAWRLRYPVAPDNEGAVAITIPRGRWQHCQKVRLRLIGDREASSSKPTSLRVQDPVFASTCSHLERR